MKFETVRCQLIFFVLFVILLLTIFGLVWNKGPIVFLAVTAINLDNFSQFLAKIILIIRVTGKL